MEVGKSLRTSPKIKIDFLHYFHSTQTYHKSLSWKGLLTFWTVRCKGSAYFCVFQLAVEAKRQQFCPILNFVSESSSSNTTWIIPQLNVLVWSKIKIFEAPNNIFYVLRPCHCWLSSFTTKGWMALAWNSVWGLIWRRSRASTRQSSAWTRNLAPHTDQGDQYSFRLCKV